ncbi:MAG: hypothetical protein JXQ30_02360 [Spirochaetes bacterium]|nr:hypothetical protein [Spirochaetota bacterium]
MKTADKRWYDKNKTLANLLGVLKSQDPADKERIVSEMKEIIMEYDQGLMDRWVLEFPLTTKRRWYDQNPYSWLVINSLKYADSRLLGGIILFLKNELEPDVE